MILFPDSEANQLIALQTRLSAMQTHAILSVSDQNANQMVGAAGLEIGNLVVAHGAATGYSAPFAPNQTLNAIPTNVFQVISPPLDPTKTTDFYFFGALDFGNTFVPWNAFVFDSTSHMVVELGGGGVTFDAINFIFYPQSLSASQDTNMSTIHLNGEDWNVGSFFVAYQWNTTGFSTSGTIANVNATLDIISRGFTP